MENCLVTKLKGTVNNPDLLKLGELRLHVKTNSGTIIATGATGVEYDYLSEPFVDNYIRTSAGEGDMSVLGKYTLASFYDPNGAFSEVDLDTIKGAEHCDALTTFGAMNSVSGAAFPIFVGDISVLSKFTSLQTIDLTSKDNTNPRQAEGDFNSLRTLTALRHLSVASSRKITGNTQWISALPHIELVGCEGTGITVNLSDFYNVLTINEIALSYMENYAYGNVEDLAANQVANGRTSGRLYIKSYGTHSHLLYNGSADWVSKTITFDSSLPNGYSIA